MSGFIYFIQGIDGGPVKIGWTQDLDKRKRQLQVGSPVRLSIVAKIPGTKEDELKLHSRFGGINSHGEWFYPRKELIAFVDEVYPEHKMQKVQEISRFIDRHSRFPNILAGEKYCIYCDRHKREVPLKGSVCCVCAEAIVDMHRQDATSYQVIQRINASKNRYQEEIERANRELEDSERELEESKKKLAGVEAELEQVRQQKIGVYGLIRKERKKANPVVV